MINIMKINLIILLNFFFILNNYAQVWQWDTPYPNGFYKNDIAFNNSTNGWIVGNYGLLMHWSGKEWIKIESGSKENLYAINILSDTNIYVSGDRGTILHYNGTKWTSSTISSNALLSLYFVNSKNGWAVSELGEIFYYNGINWNKQTSPVTTRLNSVYFKDSTHGWAVGKEGKILFYNGTSWSVQYTTLTALNDISFNNTQGWCVGNAGTIYIYDGINWVLSSKFTQSNIKSVSLFNDNTAWLSCYGRNMLYHYNGTKWDSIPSHEILTFIFSENNTGWGVAYGIYTIKNNTVSEFYENNMPDDLLYNSINSLYMLDSVNGWAVGNQHRIFQRSKDGWKLDTISLTSKITLKDVCFTNQNNGWIAASHSKLIEYKNGNWITHTMSDLVNYNSLYFIDSSHGWVVGDYGKIQKYNGYEWIDQSSIAKCLYSVFMLDTLTGWAVGDEVITKYDGTNWVADNTYWGMSFTSVYMIDKQNGWAVGSINSTFESVLFHYDGKSWERVWLDYSEQPKTNQSFKKVYMLNKDCGYLVGAGGYVAKFNGNKWIKQPDEFNQTIIDIRYTKDDRMWLSCYGGVLFSTKLTCINSDTIYSKKYLINNNPSNDISASIIDSCFIDLSINIDSAYISNVLLLNDTTLKIEWSCWQNGTKTIFFSNVIFKQTGWNHIFQPTVCSTPKYSQNLLTFVDAVNIVITEISAKDKTKINIIPNPASNSIIITGLTIPQTIEIVNSIGQLVYSTQMTEEINISNLEHGLYFVKVKTDNGIIIKKFIKQ